jgi:poly(3-hydroxybutyrate) depolymerase
MMSSSFDCRPGGVALALAVAFATSAGTLLAQEAGTVVAADKRVQGRSYVFADTGETISYALFVPSNYDPSRAWPLMVGLHGAGRPYDWLMGYEGIIDFAQRDGFIMVTPLGYHPLGGFGVPRSERSRANASRQGRPLPANISELSEKDVMSVFQIVRKEFNIDPNRLYLWGHSMGGGGTYHLAARHPDIWAGLAVGAPAPAATIDQLKPFKHIPILVLQGDADKTVPPAGTRGSVSAMNQLGMEHVYLEIKGGDHSFFLSKNRETLSKIFSFFNTVTKSQRPGGGEAPLPAVDITHSDITAFIDKLPKGAISDLPIRVADVGGYKVGTYGVFRPRSAKQDAVLHETKVTEVYYMLEGAGTLVTGGTLIEPRRTPGSTTVRGGRIEGGVSRRVAKGDLIIIPGRVPHWWSSLEGDISYLIIRPDPEGTLTLK